MARQGLAFLRDNQPAQAAAALRAALASAPNDALLWSTLGLALDRAGTLGEAAAALQRSVSLSPRRADAWLLLAGVLQRQGNLPGAESACRSALEIDPASPVAWQCLALIHQAQHRPTDAIACLTRYAELTTPDAVHWGMLGSLLQQAMRLPEARSAYTQAAALDPGNAHFRRQAARLGFICAVRDATPLDAALDAWLAATPDDPSTHDLPALFEHAAGLLSAQGATPAAARVAAHWQELFPGPTPAYLLQALNGDASLNRSPADYLVEHFDRFAPGFDAQLVGVLGYDIPEKLVRAIADVAAVEIADFRLSISDCPAGSSHEKPAIPKSAIFPRALDAGCGTGLCGPLLRPLTNHLTAVDLAPKMLAHAAQRGCYDVLECREIVQYLSESPAAFDLITAADVLIYIGDITPLFAAAAKALRPNGLLAVSIESIDGISATGFELRPSGRFAQAPAYVRAVARPAFIECTCQETTIRLEATQRMPGHLFVFRLKPRG